MNTPTPVARPQWLGLPPALCLALCLALPTPAQASTPTEKVVCTQAPRHTWLSEAQARTAFNASAYVLVRFKVSRGNCHEFYAIDPQGAVVEAYLHPVTGEAVRTTRIAPPAPIPTTHAQR
jgi:hypothetical protein